MNQALIPFVQQNWPIEEMLGDRAAGPHRRLRAVERDQAVELVPPTAGETAVAPARSAAADVLLQDDDAEIGVGLGQEVSGPQPGESAADDHDVGVDIFGQRRAIGAVLLGQRLTQPPAALGARREGVSGEI